MRYIPRPLATDYPHYFGLYAGLVPESDILRTLGEQAEATVKRLAPLCDEGTLLRYAPGKWSIKEIVGHLTDRERVFVYRAMSFARGDRTELPGVEEDPWVENADFDKVPLVDLIMEFRTVREATIRFFDNLGDGDYARRGRANGMAYGVNGVPWLIAGHERHHMAVLRERYQIS